MAAWRNQSVRNDSNFQLPFCASKFKQRWYSIQLDKSHVLRLTAGSMTRPYKMLSSHNNSQALSVENTHSPGSKLKFKYRPPSTLYASSSWPVFVDRKYARAQVFHFTRTLSYVALWPVRNIILNINSSLWPGGGISRCFIFSQGGLASRFKVQGSVSSFTDAGKLKKLLVFEITPSRPWVQNVELLTVRFLSRSFPHRSVTSPTPTPALRCWAIQSLKLFSRLTFHDSR